MTTPIWFLEAMDELGQKEVAGKNNNPRIVEYQKATGLAASDDETPWCGSFIAWVMLQSGIPYDKKNAAWAKSWLTFGHALKSPITGAIAVMQRGTDASTGHVTLFKEWADPGHTTFKALGGNQGNSVDIATFKTANVLGWRWPDEVKTPSSETPLHKSGVIQGAVATGGAAVVGVATNSGDLVSAFHSAHDQLGLGGWIGIVCFALVICGAAYAIYSRVQGAKSDRSISEPVVNKDSPVQENDEPLPNGADQLVVNEQAPQPETPPAPAPLKISN